MRLKLQVLIMVCSQLATRSRPGSHSFPEGSREVRPCYLSYGELKPVATVVLLVVRLRQGGEFVAEMELPQRRNYITSHTTGKEECQ
jgi:hypothetical protein